MDYLLLDHGVALPVVIKNAGYFPALFRKLCVYVGGFMRRAAIAFDTDPFHLSPSGSGRSTSFIPQAFCDLAISSEFSPTHQKNILKAFPQ